MELNLIRQIRLLKIYALFLTLVVAVLAFLFFRSARVPPSQTANFAEIDAERINIVDSGGRIRMVISDQKRQHPGAIDGKTLAQRDRPAGIIFFNDEGDECGGLVFDGNKNEASMVYSIDQYKNDQVMQLQYSEDSSSNRRTRSYGLRLWDRSDKFGLGDLVRLDDSLRSLHDTAMVNATYRKLRSQGLLAAERLFLGKTASKEVGLFIRDEKGRPRIEIGLDSLSNAVFQVLDTNRHRIALNP
jgi:hypothetical protein